MSSGKKVLGYTPGPAVGSSYNTKPDSTSQADWKMVLNKRKSDRRCVKRRENRAAEEEKQADEKLAAELGREKKSKRESLAVDPVVGPAPVNPVVSPPAVRSPSPAADLASLDDEGTLDDEETLDDADTYGVDACDDDQVDEQPTQRCSPERTARSPSPLQPPGTQVPNAGQLPDLPELMGELDAAEKNAAELRHILAQGLVAVQERVATAAQAPAFAECGKCCPGSGKREGHAGRHLKQLVSAAQIGEQIGDAAVSILGSLTLPGLLASRKTASSCCPWPALASRKTTSRSST